MSHHDSRRGAGSAAWLFLFATIASAAGLVYALCFALDAAGTGASMGDLFFGGHGAEMMSNMPEVVSALLGISVTVVAIIVELAANRYTPKITTLFIENPTNLAILGFFVVTCLLCVWTSLSADGQVIVPRVGTAVTIGCVTLCLLLLLPYFTFVFGFLDPHSVVDRMGRSTLNAIRKGESGLGLHRDPRKLALRGTEQLADVALNAIEHKDKGICMHAVDTMGEIACKYLSLSSSLPPSFFLLSDEVRENPDFVSMQPDVLSDIESQRCWFEMKVLRQFQMLYGETLNKMRDVNYLIAINTRRIAERSFLLERPEVAALCLKFFNTYLRATVNGRDVRTAYNVLNQYRLLAEAALRAGKSDFVVEIAQRFKYYGQLGFGMGLPFVLETAAYDLCALNELAFDLASPGRRELLGVFLEVDKEAEEGHDLDASLRGVRKAQIKLATYYLLKGESEMARAIFEDMRGEQSCRLESIRAEIEAIISRDFWEISDRGVNFDYLEPSRRAMLGTFFGWFERSSQESECSHS
jgi:hypothetical protein